jgi:hypothetical protein
MTNLIPEKPATGILKIADYGTSKFYKIECQCGNDDDQVTFEVEVTDCNDISLNTWMYLKSEYWRDTFNLNESLNQIKSGTWQWSVNYSIRSWLNDLAHRCRVTWQVWTKGYIKVQGTTMMSRQQTVNYAHTLLTAVDELEEHLKNRNKS